MDSPICAKTNSAGARIEVYGQFGRILAPDGEISMEFGAAHVRRHIDRARWPAPLPANVPDEAVAIDRYGDYRPGRCTPHGIVQPDLVAAMLAMRPADVAHMQLDDNGCGIAIAAALAGETYRAMRARLCPSGHVRMLGTRRMASATGTSRHVCASWSEARQMGAVAVLIRRARARWGHFVAFEGDVVTDPELVMRYHIAEYPRAHWQVLRCFTR